MYISKQLAILSLHCFALYAHCNFGHVSLWADKQHYYSQKRTHVLSLVGIIYHGIRWSLGELKCDSLYLLYVCNCIIPNHINANLMRDDAF